LKRPRALVIGIDAYSNPAWGLTGAVRDALAFADWVTQAGGVAPADLRLLLSPAPAVPAGAPAPGLPTSQGIVDALADLRDLKPEEGGDRVYIYYAGHGAALKGFNEPILIPVDFSNPERHGQLLLGFSKVIDYLGPAPFPEQIFFLDACRDFSLPGYEVPLQSPVGTYRPAKGKSKQYVLYSVAPGQQATEIGVGIWTKTLLDGLEGRSYKPVSLRLGQFVVRLDDLAQWINGEVHERLVNATLATASAVQEPEYVPDPKGVNPVLTAFSKETAPRARVSVFVEPALALSTCRVEVKEFSAAHAGDLVPFTQGPLPPIAPPLEFELFPSEYSIEAQADRFTVVSQPWTVTDDPVVELTLEQAQEPAEPPPPPDEAPTDLGTKTGRSAETAWRGSFDLDDFELEARGVRGGARRRSPPPASGPGTLTVRCADPFVRVKLLDTKRKEVEERLDVGKPLPLAPGLYRLRAWLPGDRPSESTVEVRPGRPTEVNLKVPVPRLGPLQIEWLKERGMEDQAGTGKSAYLRPSELLGRVAGVRLGSLLAYAAYAANWNGSYFNKLRSFGVPPFPERGEQVCGVLILVGVAGGQNAGEIEGFLRGCSADLLRDGQTLAAGIFTPLSGLPAGAAWQTVLDRPGPLLADLRLPGFGATRYALAALPGRLSVLVAVLESDGTVDVQQILLPLTPETPSRDFLKDPTNVRKVDLGVRAFAAGEMHPLNERDLKDLLAGRWIDPILACVAGYSLARAGEPERFLGQVRRGALDDLDPDAPPRVRPLEKSALVNLLSLFPGLPDAWVLAGVCDPSRQEEHFGKAVRRGVPLCTEGLRILGPRPEPLAGLLPGSPWTAWTVQR
jgi:hypothetical protein